MSTSPLRAGVPSSTYRIQLSPAQDLAAARELVGYLDALGVGALYCSPILQAAPGSTHGYDVVDPTRVNDELGGEDARRELVAALREAGLRALVDLVPNHMGVAVPAANPSWWSLLREGAESPYASWYDVDLAAGPVLIPVLGVPEAVESLTLSDDGTELHYVEHRFPVAPGTGAEGTPQEVHERQHYRLVHWRRGNAELTYRRFFDVSDLAAVRIEDPAVFEATHAEALRWVREDPDVLAGLRIDHPDGLTAPSAYVRRLRDALGEDAWLLVEKILMPGETLPASWPADGTTGYDALREVGGVFVDPRGEQMIDAVAAERTGTRERLSVAEHRARRLVTDEILVAEMRRIAALVPPAGASEVASLTFNDRKATSSAPAEGEDSSTPSSADRAEASPPDDASAGTPSASSSEDVDLLTSDVSDATSLAPEGAETLDAVSELLSSFPVYRSYLPEGRGDLDRAVDTAATRRPDLAPAVRRIHAAMVAEPDGPLTRRVEQTSGMVTAKGVEDTTFYRWNRFVALNEVGGAPDRFGVSPSGFHAGAARRDAASPATMTTLSTHDTKRSEDVRARLAVLSEVPAEWGTFLREMAARHPLPSPSLELLAWQSLLGAWPITAERLAGYLTKAAKEAKLVTSHVDADAEADAAIAAWPGAVLGDPDAVATIEALVARIGPPGRSNSLGQKLLQIAGPGVPDVYQGTDALEYSLVDPDNRRPVDVDLRRRLLARIDGGWSPSVGADPATADGLEELMATKLLVTASALRLRRFRPELFDGYAPVPADGPAAAHAIAFARGGPAGAQRLVAVATRLPVGLAAAGGWGDTVLPLPGGADDWTDVVTGEAVDGAAPALATLLARYPVALLVRPA